MGKINKKLGIFGFSAGRKRAATSFRRHKSYNRRATPKAYCLPTNSSTPAEASAMDGTGASGCDDVFHDEGATLQRSLRQCNGKARLMTVHCHPMNSSEDEHEIFPQPRVAPLRPTQRHCRTTSAGIFLRALSPSVLSARIYFLYIGPD